MPLSDHPMWRRPQHHLDSDHASDHVHWVELFYDLIHVVTIFMLGNFLSHHLTIEGFVAFFGMFTAVWVAWGDSSAFNSLYVSTDMRHRAIMSIQICTVMVIAAAIPDITGDGWVYFAMGYAANRAITAYLFYRAIRTGAEHTGLAWEAARNFFGLALLFAISAWLPAPYGYYLFGAGIIMLQLSFILPKIGLLRFERFIPRLGHLSERLALLVLIVIGEGFFKLVVTLSEKGISHVSADVMMNFIIGGISLFSVCWIYFDFIGNAKLKNTESRTMMTWWYGHFLLMLAAVMIGVSLTGEVKVGLWEPFPAKYAWLGCPGLAIYIACIWVIQQTIEPRLAHQFAPFWLRAFGVSLALITLAVVHYVPAIVGNLLWGTALFSQIAVPLLGAYRRLSRE